jgi:hypothetical protein
MTANTEIASASMRTILCPLFMFPPPLSVLHTVRKILFLCLHYMVTGVGKKATSGDVGSTLAGNTEPSHENGWHYPKQCTGCHGRGEREPFSLRVAEEGDIRSLRKEEYRSPGSSANLLLLKEPEPGTAETN